jgi:RNA polymerase sigma-70 factor (ECF subfamily)
MSGRLADPFGFPHTAPGPLGNWHGRRGAQVQDRNAQAEADRSRGALMAAAQDGDRAAYSALLRDCLPLLRAIVRRQGVPPDSVEDAVQEVLLTLHRVRHTYDPARSFTAWLGGIARHRALDQLRRTGARARLETHAPDEYEAYAEPGEGPDAALQRGDAARRLRAAVASLPAGQREAVQLLALDDASLAEAAGATGKTKVALKVSLHRALKTLRLRMEGRGDE